MIAGLLLTLTTASLGIAYACRCTGNGGGTCCGTDCYTDSSGNCHCSGPCAE